MKHLAPIAAAGSLVAGVWVSVRYFLGGVDQETFKQFLMGATAVWFVTATWWSSRK